MEHGRHAMLSFLCSPPVSVLCIFDIEANMFYERNHYIYVVNKGIDFIGLPIIFQEKGDTPSTLWESFN